MYVCTSCTVVSSSTTEFQHIVIFFFEKKTLFIPTRCLPPFSDDCHDDEDELDEVVEGYHFHLVFGSTRPAPSLGERLIRSLPYLFAGWIFGLVPLDSL